jgi:NAD(P)-dependent dehydrogenase (short-subunit alcohol dehydrogenase family)
MSSLPKCPTACSTMSSQNAGSVRSPGIARHFAPAYVFLASNADSSYITGTVLQVMGGETTGG